MGIDQPDDDDGLAHARDLSGVPASRQPRGAGDTFHAMVAPEDATVASEKTAVGSEAAGAVSKEVAVVSGEATAGSEAGGAVPEEAAAGSEAAAAGSEEAAAGSEEAAAGSDGNEDQDRAETSDAGIDRQVRIDRVTEHRATVDAAYRAYAIDQAYEKISEIERGTVTPAMRRIEAEDPDRHLAGLENRLKGKDRFAEKVLNAIDEQPQLSYDNACALIKDAIRYTFQYPDDQYSAGVLADCDRLERAGFKRVDRRNTWESPDYKGVNSRWRAPESDQMLEVQFHTRASYEAKQETHSAYEKLRNPATPKTEQDHLVDYQRQVNTRVPIPPGALDIPDYP